MKVEGQLLCSPKIDGSDVMLTNLMLALVNFKMAPADIVAP